MKLVANIQLKPTPEQAALLKATLETCNRACNEIAQVALGAGKFRQYDIHHLCYYNVKAKFNLSAQLAVRCLSKVADAYKIGPKTKTRHFRPDSAQPYDDRIFRFLKKRGDMVSIWLLGGRQAIPFVCGERQRELLEHRKGEVDLMLIRGKWYIACVCDIPDPKDIEPNGVLGVDLGIVNLAFDSEGTCYSGSAVEEQRRIHSHRRANLQKNGSKSAKRKLHSLKGKQARFQKNTNHVISKKIVQAAQRSQSSIALEDLTGIRDGVKARRRQRNKLHNWGFAQLRQFIAYKAKQLGTPLVFVDPRNTSRECPVCHAIDKANRPSQSVFSCVSCGHHGIADHIAALNIRARAVINQPMVGCFS